MKKEFQEEKIIKFIQTHLLEPISLAELFSKINFMLPSYAEITIKQLVNFISTQYRFKVFRAKIIGEVNYIFVSAKHYGHKNKD